MEAEIEGLGLEENIAYYVYILKSKSSRWLYIGYTGSLQRRPAEHKAGKSKTTVRLGTTELVYYEAFNSSKDAKKREGQLKKHGAALGHLKNRIQDSINV